MNIEKLEVRISAIEVMLFAIVQQLNVTEFLSDFEEQKNLAISALSNTSVSDERITALESRLEQYLIALNLKS